MVLQIVSGGASNYQRWCQQLVVTLQKVSGGATNDH
jgi:hypothetical protein